jgi:hypothetical protein
MISCWDEDKFLRPNFTDLRKHFESLLATFEQEEVFQSGDLDEWSSATGFDHFRSTNKTDEFINRVPAPKNGQVHYDNFKRMPLHAYANEMTP